ncbi:helix-turn-helix transcriptional regulator [candidate division WOR-3 bacterium]|nr:helix-turn-helix transcriptional regulator [candidate division WOR-3 bacterium]
MGRRSHPPLAGMDRLGQRLRELRQQAGVSQTELARRLGFDPTHGYKYVLRLERGLVPNPTLRTLTGYIEACGAAWDRISDVLPTTTRAAPAGADTQPQKPDEPQVPEPVAPKPPTPRRRDPRPLREQLRARRIEERRARDRAYWVAVARVEEQVRRLLRAARISPRSESTYLAYARTCCGLLGNETAKPDATERQLTAQTQTAVQSGLERHTIQQIEAVCRSGFSSFGAAEGH